MNVNMIYDFMQVLNSIRKHPIKNEYFSKHILFSTIYLLQEQKLNIRNYSEQEIIMGSFVNAIEQYVHMYANFGDFCHFGYFFKI
jgi:hypothetical protein